MKQSTGDVALFFRKIADGLVALSGTYVDDTLQAGPEDIKIEIQNQIRKHFDAKINDTTQFIYSGILCDVSDPNVRTLSQKTIYRPTQISPKNC